MSNRWKNDCQLKGSTLISLVSVKRLQISNSLAADCSSPLPLPPPPPSTLSLSIPSTPIGRYIIVRGSPVAGNVAVGIEIFTIS